MKKILSPIVVIFSVLLFAQCNDSIEKKLYDHFKKTQIDYYSGDITQKDYDTIYDENKVFTEELFSYLKTHPESIEKSLSSLAKDGFVITTSHDSNFRVYSWSINLGGKDNFTYNIFQYRYKNKNGIWADKGNDFEGGYVVDLFETNLNGKQYYFPYLQSTSSGRNVNQEVVNFRVDEDGISNEDKLFGTSKDGESSLMIMFDFFSVVDHSERPVRLITFEAKTNTFTLPYINPRNLKVSSTETENYKFNGKYFK